MTPCIRLVPCVLLLLCALTACRTSPDTRKASEVGPELPLAVADCTLAPDGKAKFLSSLRLFADRDGFAIRIAQVSPVETGMLVQMYRDDLKLIGTNPFDADEYSLAMFSNDGSATSETAARDALGSLVNMAAGAACAMHS